MITVKTALTFDRVRERIAERAATQPPTELPDDEQPRLEYLDSVVESHVFGQFDGEPFVFPVPSDFASPQVIGALRRRWEARQPEPDADHWKTVVFGDHDTEGHVGVINIVFVPMTVAPAVDEIFTAQAFAALSPSSPLPAPRPNRDRPRVLLVSDVPGWAFDINMHDLAEHLAARFEFGYFYTENFHKGERVKWNDWDVVYEAYHRNPPMGLPYSRACGALRSEWFKAERREPPTSEDVALVNRYRSFQVACKRNYDELRDRCPNVVYLTNPVNTRRFQQTPLRDRIVPSWNGNAGHKSPDGRYIKHYYDIVVPAALRAGMPLVAAEYGTPNGPQRRRTPAEMPAFYEQANVALCASEYEAASNSVMEAMAAGLALIATDVGNHRELRDAQLAAFGDTGIILVDSDVREFTKALKELTPARAHEMGRVNRAEIEARWSWSVWADQYQAFLEMAL